MTPHRNKYCLKCNQHFDAANPFFQCSFCGSRVHCACTIGKYNEKEIEKLKRQTTPFHFACFNCEENFTNGSLKASITASEKQALLHAKEMEKLKNLYEHKANDMLELLNEKDEIIQQKTRESKLNKIGAPGPSGKRTRFEENENFDETFSGFLPTKDIIAEIVKQAIAPIVDTLSLFQRRLDDQAVLLGNLRQPQPNMQTQNQFPMLPDLRLPTTPRNAITPRTNKPRLSRKDEARIQTLSYAQAVALAAMPAENIRNISIMGEHDEALKIANTLRKDNLFADMPINAINTKGPTNLTFKCNDKETAKAIAEKLQTKYHGKVTVSNVNPTPPQLKITKLYTDEVHADIIMNQLIESNPVLDGIEFKIEQFYETTPSRGEPFKNIVISTTLENHTILLEKGRLIFNMCESRIYEYVNILMCAKCLRYGHFARTCTFNPVCKRCSLNHQTSECIATEPLKNMKCINCIQSNRRGKNYGTRHRPTDERCQTRLERIAALKEQLLLKN